MNEGKSPCHKRVMAMVGKMSPNSMTRSAQPDEKYESPIFLGGRSLRSETESLLMR